jgi:3-oxoacyl-[acyl-carrier protein] reductase
MNNKSTRRIVITGASRGIGRAIAQHFADEKCQLVLVGRDAGALAEAASICSHAASVEVVLADLGNAVQREALLPLVETADVLVNNAGDIPAGSISKFSAGEAAVLWAPKLLGYYDLSSAALSAMSRRKQGVIVNVIGMAGVVARPDYVLGSMANAALIAMTQALGARSTDFGVRVVGINPPATATDRIVRLARSIAEQKLGDAERWKEGIKDLPFGRLGSTEEVAQAVLWIASESASYLSGTVLDLDGGKRFR